MLKKYINKLVMAFTAKHIADYKEEEPVKAPLPLSSLNLSKPEVELLLLTIRDMSFKGEHVEKVYTLVLKLQEYYMSLNR